MKEQKEIKQICIHKSGWKDWHKQIDWEGADDIRKYHMEKREFSDIGYHYVILRDGTLQTGRKLKYTPASCKGHNDSVAAICLIGEFTREEPSEAQINSLKILLLKLCREYKIDTDMHHIFTHSDYRDPAGNRYCPGKYLHRKIPEVSNWVRQAIRKGVK